MLYLLLSLIALGVISAIFGLLSHNKEGGSGVIMSRQDYNSCSGDNQRCEQVCMMEAATNPVEYYDDEELDRFARRASDNYTDEEAESFRNVFYTMNPAEVKPWTRSLTLRGINLPDQVKDEVVMLIEGTQS